MLHTDKLFFFCNFDSRLRGAPSKNTQNVLVCYIVICLLIGQASFQEGWGDCTHPRKLVMGPAGLQQQLVMNSVTGGKTVFIPSKSDHTCVVLFWGMNQKYSIVVPIRESCKLHRSHDFLELIITMAWSLLPKVMIMPLACWNVIDERHKTLPTAQINTFNAAVCIN